MFQLDWPFALSVQVSQGLINNTQDNTILLNHQHAGNYSSGFFLSTETKQDGENVPSYTMSS